MIGSRSSRALKLPAQTINSSLMLAVVLVLVLYPVVEIVLNSFQVTRPGEATQWGLDGWREVFQSPSVLSSLWNTFVLTVARTAISYPIAIVVAWILARTDIPGSEWLEFLFWVAFFVPALPVTLGWIMLLAPDYGLINQAFVAVTNTIAAPLNYLGIDISVTDGPFNIYSFWGIVWTHLVHTSISIKVILLTPIFRNMDSSLEEASRLSGVGVLGTLVRITLPMMTPVLLSTLLLSIIYSLQTFEIELILGPPFRFNVFSTEIYFLLGRQPSRVTEAAALSTAILTIMIPFIVLQRRRVNRRKYTTVGGQFRGQRIQLRKWRRPAFLGIAALALGSAVIPLGFLVMGTFMKLFGFFEIPQPWTLSHWSRVLEDPMLIRSLWNTVLLGAGTSLCIVVLCTLMGYVIMRTRYKLRGTLDFLSWFPATLPGIILGVGLLSLFLGNAALRPFYGTMVVMLLGTVVASMTTATQVIKSNFAQLGFDIEEAGRVGSGTWWDAFRRILLPIITPTLLVIGSLSFVSAVRNVSTVALLSTSRNRPLSLLQLDYMVEGRYESAAVTGVLIVVMTTGIALIARLLGRKAGIERGRSLRETTIPYSSDTQKEPV